MARAELIGLCKCHECGFPDAEIRPDKGGNPYRFCPDCTAQYFSRGVPHKVKNLLAQIREPDKPAASPEVIPVAALKKDATEIAAESNRIGETMAKQARKAFSLDQL